METKGRQFRAKHYPRRFAKFSTLRLWRLCQAFFIKKHLKNKAAIFYLCAEKERYPGTLSFVQKYRRYLGEDRTIIVQIDNSSENLPPAKASDGSWKIGGDNSFWEFSGWRKGVEFLASKTIDVDIAIFINDACLNFTWLGQDELFFKMRFDWFSVCRGRSAFVGFVDRSKERHMLKGYEVSRWIRSNFFCMPFSLAKQLEWVFFSEEARNRIIPKKYEGVVLTATNDMNDNLRVFLSDWITSRWHRSTRITDENWQFFRNKLTSILNERMLTAKITEKGYDVFNAETLKWF